MNNKKFKVLIVGMGKMGIAHACILKTLNNVDTISFIEPDIKLSNIFKKLGFSGSIFHNINDLEIICDIDIIFITCPTQHHSFYIEFAINNNIPYFVEKPACLSVDDISKLIKLPEFNKTKGMVGFMMRFVPTFRLLKEFINMKLLGEINIIQCSMNVSQVFSRGSGWRFKKETSGGGVVATQGIHLIDLLYWYFGMPNAVHSVIASPYSLNVEDTASLLFDYGKFGITANISWSSHEKRLLETIINIQGDNGSIIVDDDNIELYLTRDINKYKRGYTVINKHEISELSHFDIGAPAYSLQDKFFIDSLNNNNKIDNDLISSLYVQSILEDIYK